MALYRQIGSRLISVAAIMILAVLGDRSGIVPLPLARAQSTSIVRIGGLDFSPYINGQDPNSNPPPQITTAQITARLTIIAPYAKWVRSFSMTNGFENIPSIARSFGLKVAANAWIGPDTTLNAQEVSNLIAAANAGLVDIAIVGSEAILRGDVTVAQLISYMKQVRQAIPPNIPVTTADVYGTFLANPDLISASDVVFGNFYPYWEGTSINNAVCSLQQEYQQLVTAAGSKSVWISETGWPSAGDAEGAAVPSAANENLYALQFFTWASSNSIPALYFEAFDEAWKGAYEGPQGSHWGVFDVNGVIKPGIDAFFNGQIATVNCNGTLPGSPGISFTYVPPYGSSDELEAQVSGVQPASYVVAAYIYVVGQWWTKPTFAQPTVAINPDGTVRIKIESGGTDYDATAIAAFLIPSGVTPPACGNPNPGCGTLPSVPGSIASSEVTRTQSSINGIIMDTQGSPIAGAVVSSPTLGGSTSGPDGKYSYYQITASGTASLTVTAANYVFPMPPTAINISAGNQFVNFVGTPLLPLLTVTKTHVGSFQQGQIGALYTVTVTNATGAGQTNGAVSVTETVPTGLTLLSMYGFGWSCSSNVCARSDALGAGFSYSPITVTVNVSANAPASLINFVSVSGGGSATSGASDSTTVQNPCDVNQYGTTTVADIQTVINEALGSAPAVNDLNRDGIVNVVDIDVVIESKLNLGCRAH
jgi:uncharacterized repeat protein (TIGR01451 family)